MLKASLQLSAGNGGVTFSVPGSPLRVSSICMDCEVKTIEEAKAAIASHILEPLVMAQPSEIPPANQGFGSSLTPKEDLCKHFDIDMDNILSDRWDLKNTLDDIVKRAGKSEPGVLHTYTMESPQGVVVGVHIKVV